MGLVSYIIPFLAFALVLYNPLSDILFGVDEELGCEGYPRVRRTERPVLDERLLAVDGENSTAPICGGGGGREGGGNGDGGDGYRVHIYSREPLVVYIEGFLSEGEREGVLDLSTPLFTPSTTTSNAGLTTHLNPSIRDSDVALLPRTDLVRCIELRARSFQGWREDVWVERLRTQRYGPRGHYGGHFDWSGNRGGWGRVSSFMVWVAGGEGAEGEDGLGGERGCDGGDGSWEGVGEEGMGRDGVEVGGDGEEGWQCGDEEVGGEGRKLKGGGTEFPYLKRGDEDGEWGRVWCKFIECGKSSSSPHNDNDNDDEAGGTSNHDGNANDDGTRDVRWTGKRGVVFKPNPGNAVYWENFHSDGTARGYEETWHSGLPVEEGVKVGLNIWSWGRID